VPEQHEKLKQLNFMGRQDGVIKLTGPVGDFSFYRSKDGHLMRLKGGVNGDRIKNDPAFARTRENGAEFGRAGKATKLLRTALRTLVMNVSDNRITSRLTQQMMRVIQADATNARGLRNVVDGEATLLKGFEFNQNARLDKTFFAPYTALIDRGSGQASISLPEYNPLQMVAAPPGSTHYRMVAGAAEVDFGAGSHVFNQSQGADIPVTDSLAPALVLTPGVTPGSTAVIFLVFGIEFYQEVNGVQYALRNGAYNALTIVEVDA